MHSLLNRIFLFALSCCFLLFLPLNTLFIFLLFMAISITCFNYFFEMPIFHFYTTLLWGVLACFLPQALWFFPLIAYDMLLAKSIYPFIPYIIAFFIRRDTWTLLQGIFLCIGFLCAILLHYYSKVYDSLTKQFKKSRDDSMELQALLQDKNRTLIQKQNAEIYAATLKERNRIAREIHDNVGHLLSRSILMTGALKATSDKTTLTPNIQVLEKTLTSAMDTIRSSVHDLHNRSIDLHETFQSLLNDFHYCDISLDYDVQSEIPADIKYTCIAILKEGLSNIIKHSNATKVVLLLREHQSLYQFSLYDNGTTTTLPITLHDNATLTGPITHTGIGLVNIKERVRSLQGHLQITTDSGFRIFITIPKQGGTHENTDY